GPMIAGSSRRDRTSGATSSGTIPVAVAPPGSRTFTLTAEPARSAAMTRESASTPAPAGPYGTKPARTIVSRFIEMFTTRPPPAAPVTSARIPSSSAMRGTVPGIPFGAAVMIVMTPHASPAEIEAVTTRLKTTGVHVVVMPGELTTAIGAIGDPEGVAELGLEGMSGVDRVVPISRPYKLASSELSHFEPTIVEVDGHRIGAPDTFCLIAGPCTVESREQTLAVARAVAAAGAAILRGGAFKPRTSPFAFKGLG